MKRILWLSFIILIAVGCAYFIYNTPGYVAIQIEHWLIALPLWLAIAGLIVSVCFILFLIKSFIWVISMPGQLSAFWSKKRFKKQVSLWKLAVGQWLTGDWGASEKSFKQLAGLKFVPEHSLLLAANSAQEDGRYEDSLAILHQAQKFKNLSEPLAFLLLKIEALWQEGKHSQAFDELESIAQNPKYSHHLSVIKLRWAFLIHFKRFNDCLNLLPDFKKSLGPSSDQYYTFQIEIYSGILNQSKSLSSVNNHWAQIPDQLKKDANLVYIYSQKSVHFGEKENIKKLLIDYLNKQFDDQLFNYFCSVDLNSNSNIQNLISNQIKPAEIWCQRETPSADRFCAMGVLCLQAELYAQAKHYLDESLKLKPNHINTLKAQADLLAKQGEFKLACEQYLKAFNCEVR